MTRPPGWDAQEISRIASHHYGGFQAMFAAHSWPERGSEMMRAVQSRVSASYGSVSRFVTHHDALNNQEKDHA